MIDVLNSILNYIRRKFCGNHDIKILDGRNTWERVRQTLEIRFKFVSQKLNVLDHVLVGPFSSIQILYKWKKPSDQHCWKIGGRSLCDEVLMDKMSESVTRTKSQG